MYAYISGIVDDLLPDRAILEAGGVGYELFCSAMTLKRLRAGQKKRLYTHLHLAEGVMALYGFYDTDEKDMFRRLLSVTRVGPKLALSVLSVLSPSDVAGFFSLLFSSLSRQGLPVFPISWLLYFCIYTLAYLCKYIKKILAQVCNF